jgi:AcrR family transcriptional regulator
MGDTVTTTSPASAAAHYYEEIWAHVQPEGSRRLLRSALDCFAEKGFEGTSTREIAQKAGMSPSALYVHYTSKSDLLFAISKIGHGSSYETTAADVAAVEGPTARLTAFVTSFVAWHARYHTLARVNQYQLGSLEAEQLATITEIRRRFQRDLEGILRSGVDAGEFDVDDRHGTARAILSLGIDVARWFADDGALRPEDLAAQYARLALRMVRPNAA